jgi:hypothetical protein
MGLVGVLATQLWHHIFIEPSLAELPGKEWGLRNGEWAVKTGRQDGERYGVAGPHLPHAPLPISHS